MSRLAAARVQAASIPDRAVRLIISFPPGGCIDTLGRILMQKLGAAGTNRRWRKIVRARAAISARAEN